MVMPHLQFASPLLHLLPKSARVNPYIQASMEPGLSQVQNVLGSAAGRPKAPFDYTNTWSDCLTILLPFLFVGWWSGTSRRHRLAVVGIALIALAPLLYSLNRGAWIGVGVSVGYLAIRFALRGKTALLAGLAAVIAISALLVLATPLKGVITGRLHNGKSNNLRANLSGLAITDGLASPIIGFGDTRQERGSPRSIAIGPSLKCPTCGQLEVGSTGQLWLLLVVGRGARCRLVPSLLRQRHLVLPARSQPGGDGRDFGIAAVLRLHVHLRRRPRAAWLHHARLRSDVEERHVSATAGRDRRSVNRPDGDALAYLAETLPLPAIDLAAFEAATGQPEPPAELARVARGGVLNLGGALFSAIASLGLTVVVTQNFSKPVAGAFFIAMSLFLIVEGVANLGAYNGTIYFIARLRALHADRRIPAIMRATVIPVLFSSIVGAIAVIVFAHPLAKLLIDGQSAGGVERGERRGLAAGTGRRAAVRRAGRHLARCRPRLPEHAAHGARRPDRARQDCRRSG